MLSTNQEQDIQMIAMKGKAVASVIGSFTPIASCPPEDIGLSVYALEEFFADILKILSEKDPASKSTVVD